jgi:predicted dehydrogenase
MKMGKTLGVGLIGCGNISTSYLGLAPMFNGIEIRACADINADAAKARAEEYDIRAETVGGLLVAEDIDIVVNLTVPAVHYEVSAQVLDAGKHVYSEKPFVLSVEQGRDLAARAKKGDLRVGSAPDTFLGGAHQLARNLIDTGKIGRVTGGTCHVLSPGMEHWHPNPDFFFQAGGGPILDLGPYYISNLVQLIGPVRRVVAMSSIPTPERKITSKPRYGEMIKVETPTTVHAVLEFGNGALVTLGQLGRQGPWPPPDGTLWHRGQPRCSGSEFLRWRGRTAQGRWCGPRTADMGSSAGCAQSAARPRHDGQLPRRRACRNGGCHYRGPSAPLFTGICVARG